MKFESYLFMSIITVFSLEVSSGFSRLGSRLFHVSNLQIETSRSSRLDFLLYSSLRDTKEVLPRKKKQKKNKYAKFSKADKQRQDPFEALVEESKQKLLELEQAQNSKNNMSSQVNEEARPVQQIVFPNVKDIDPYDPTTFGYVEIGFIEGPHGVNGWVKVKGCTDFPERLTRPGMLLHIKPLHKRAPRRVTLASGKMIPNESFLIQLQGIYNRTAAENLKGSTLYYATQQDPVSHDDDFLVSDLVGSDVFLKADDRFVGTVQAILLAEEMCSIPGIGHDMLEVAIAKPDRVPGQPQQPNDLVLIPLVPEIVPKIDLAERIIQITPPNGLLNLTYIKEEKVRIRGLLPPAKEP